jgi:hypothetical protein
MFFSLQRHRASRSRTAELRFLSCNGCTPHTDALNPERTTLRAIAHDVEIDDIRAKQPAPSLEREGFQLFSGQATDIDLLDLDSVLKVYLPELKRFIARITGADHVFALRKPVLRSIAPLPACRRPVVQEGTADLVHVDYTPVSARVTARIAAAEDGVPALPAGRLMALTVWRSLTPPPQNRPLSLCDVRSVAEEDLVRGEASGTSGSPTEQSEYLAVRYNPRQRWHFFSDMKPDELLVFKQYDSGQSGPSGTPHSAFMDPLCRRPVHERRSLEVRLFTVHSNC